MTPVTFFESFPLIHVIDEGGVLAEVPDEVLDVDAEVASWKSFTLIVGLEKVKPAADNCKKPPESLTTVVATFAVPSMLTTETVALIGAFEKP